MPKMIVNSKVILHRPSKADPKVMERIVLKPAGPGKPKTVFDFKADERDSILAQHLSALSKLDSAVEVEAAPPPPAQGGNVGSTGDKDNAADQQSTGGSVDGDQHTNVEDSDKL